MQMYEVRRVDRRLIDRLDRCYPSLVKNAVEYIQDSPTELIIKLNDGSTVLYEDIDQTVRVLPQDSSNMTEQQCRHEFSVRLRQIMFKRGITQKELSEETGISEVTLSHYITGKRTPNFYNVDKISKALRCSIDSLRYY